MCNLRLEAAGASVSHNSELSLSGWTGYGNPQISELPEGTLRFTGLTSLNLAYNKLSSLPISVASAMTFLKKLDISANRFVHLPLAVYLLGKSLVSLNASSNQLTSMNSACGDGTLSQLTQLQELDIRFNANIDLPPDLSSILPHLSTLHCDVKSDRERAWAMIQARCMQNRERYGDPSEKDFPRTRSSWWTGTIFRSFEYGNWGFMGKSGYCCKLASRGGI